MKADVSRNPVPRWVQISFIFFLFLYAVYAAGYIYKTSFIVNGERFFVLFDDAMISMRYARNLVRGEGLVWNPGERVEGFTNPLWVLFMAFFHFFPISLSKISLPIQIAGALFFITSLFFIKKIAEQVSNSPYVPLLAVGFTAFYVNFSTWSLLGMEVSLLLLATNIAVWMSLSILKNQDFSSKRIPWLYTLLGVSTLIRIDMVVVYLAIFSFLVYADRHNRRRHISWGLIVLIFFLGAQTLFRFFYYGELLPNTYYLKVTGVPAFLMIKRGIFVFFKFVWNFNSILFLIPFFYLIFKRDQQRIFLCWVFLSMCAYSIYVGGDAWEEKGGANRFISTTLPLFFVLFSVSIEGFRKRIVKAFQAELISVKEKMGKNIQIGSYLGLIVFSVISLLNFNALIDMSSLKFWLLLEPHPFVVGSNRYVHIYEVLDHITTEDANIAVVTAGIIPYYTDRPSIDLLGKSDAYIAKQPMRVQNVPLIDIRPGHMKWDYSYSVSILKPDVVAQLWDGYKNTATTQYLENYTKVLIHDFPLFLRNDSPNILWDKLNDQILY